jgi:hypothetical protein
MMEPVAARLRAGMPRIRHRFGSVSNGALDPQSQWSFNDGVLMPATGSLHIRIRRPALAPLTFRAAALGGGRRIKFVEVVIEDRHGNRCATGQSTMIDGGSAPRPLPNC